jgi:ubiquinone/menaquinone biosynthesis C-methylase UbiE
MSMPIIDESSLSKLLSENVTLRLIEPHIYSVIQDGVSTNFFDKMASFYDLVICNPLYNRLVWGYSVKNYDILTHNALTSSKDGWVLDAGCGSLAFTARTYLRYSERPVVLLDHSFRLLRIAKSRLTRLNGDVPANMVFLQGDALQLPFRPKIFKTIISLNLLHVLDDVRKVLLGFRNILTDHGTMSFTTLIENNRFADKYLYYVLGKAAGVVPRKAHDLFEMFNDISMPVKFDIMGNMAFIYYNI